MVKKNIQLRKWHVLSLLALVFAVAISAGAVFAAAPTAHSGSRASASTMQGARDHSTRPFATDAFVSLQPNTTDAPGTCPAPPNGGTTTVGCTFALDMFVDAGTNIAPNGLTAQQSYLTFTSSLMNVTRKLASDPLVTCVATNTVLTDLTVFDAALQNETCNNQAGGCTFRGVLVGPGSIAYASGALTNCPNGCPDPGQPSPQDQPVFRVGKVPVCAVAAGQVLMHWQFSDPSCSAFPPAPITRDSELVTVDGSIVSDCHLYTDYIFNVVALTSTPAPPTLTPTITNTPLPPTNTFTPLPPTLTFTPIPPTFTFTPLPPTFTFTPIPPTVTNTPLPTNTPAPNPNQCALADHYFLPTNLYPAPGGTVTCDQPTQHCTGTVGSRVQLDEYVHPPAIDPPGSAGITAQQGYIDFNNGTQDYLRVQLARVSDLATTCTLTSTVTADLTVFDATLQNETCNGPAPCVFRGVTVGPGSYAFASGALANNPYPAGSPDFRVAQTGWCLSAVGTATLRWQFTVRGDPITRDTEIVEEDGTIINNPLCYVDFTFTITAPATATTTAVPATNTNTAVPTNTNTAVPTNTNTAVPTNTNTAVPTNTNTAVPTNTNTAIPTNTNTAVPTNTNTAVPTSTRTPVLTFTPTNTPANTATDTATSTFTPVNTSTNTAVPTNTNTRVPTNTNTAVPTNTNTRVPTNTNTAVPTNTNTAVPTNTNTRVPTNTNTAVPTNTNTAVPTNTNTRVPTNTNTAVPTNTNTRVPTNTNTRVPTNTNTTVPTNTNTAVPTNTRTTGPTNTRTPTPNVTGTPCTDCDVKFINASGHANNEPVTLMCNPDGTLHWTATLINKPDHDNDPGCTLTVPYRVSLQVHCGEHEGDDNDHGCAGSHGDGWTTVQVQHGIATLPPRVATTFQGDFCYHWPANADKLRVEFALDSTRHECNKKRKSHDIHVCPVDPTCPPSGPEFPDVVGSVFAGNIQQLSNIGVISGYSDGTFKPSELINRGQVAKMVVIANGLRSAGSEQHFSDVPASNPYFSYVEAAYAQGVISGYSDGTFRPYESVTRGQIAKIVVQASGLNLVSPTTPSFTDVPTTSVFYSYIETAKANGLLNGYSDGTFRANETATRGQVSKIVSNSLFESE